jgi:hypothetical protein
MLSGALVVIAFGCNSIVGVTDVKPKSDTGTLPRSSSSSSSGDPVLGDDDDSSSGVVQKDAGNKDSGGGTLPKKTPCNGTTDCERIVFVTSQTFTGNLGGISGADDKCVTAAKANPSISGIAFRAWLSDSGIDAKTRLVNGTKAYRRTDNTVMATTWTDLTDSSLILPLALDETGKQLTGSEFDRSTWTGTDPTGTWDGSTTGTNDTCLDWLSDSVTNSASFGDSDTTDVNWSEVVGEPVATSSCNALKHIYCFEY